MPIRCCMQMLPAHAAQRMRGECEENEGRMQGCRCCLYDAAHTHMLPVRCCTHTHMLPVRCCMQMMPVQCCICCQCNAAWALATPARITQGDSKRATTFRQFATCLRDSIRWQQFFSYSISYSSLRDPIICKPDPFCKHIKVSDSRT